jgi:hypothetical protein
LNLNGSTISPKHYEPAHTDGDISATFGEADILHTGDTYWNGIYPFIDYSTGGSIEGMIRAPLPLKFRDVVMDRDQHVSEAASSARLLTGLPCPGTTIVLSVAATRLSSSWWSPGQRENGINRRREKPRACTAGKVGPLRLTQSLR